MKLYLSFCEANAHRREPEMKASNGTSKFVNGSQVTSPEAESIDGPSTENWLEGDWESYLKTLEVGLKEIQISSVDLDREAIGANIFDLSSGSAPTATAEKVERLLSLLSEKQRYVLRATYWEGKSERKIASMMGVSRPAIQRIKRRAFHRLRSIGVDTVSIFQLVRAQSNAHPENEGGNRE